jgi:hypothetical protein
LPTLSWRIDVGTIREDRAHDKHNEQKRLLRFGRGNAKLDSGVFTFSLPAGHFCPHARACRAQADRRTGFISDGKAVEFRCYAATSEARARSVRESRWHNAELLKGCRGTKEMAALLLRSLSPFAGVVRIHVAGDFFSQAYLDAWLAVAVSRPRTLFYGYTKGLPFWVRRLDELGTGREPGAVPNFVLTASVGGTHDHLIAEYGLRAAKVVFTEQEAVDLGLPLDHDDTHAMTPGGEFALLVHGAQPAGSEAAKALARLRQSGEFGYGERADRIRHERGRPRLALTVV